MFSKILVPLDGSPFSEAVLPQVNALAKCMNAEVILLRVIPTPLYNLVFASGSAMPIEPNPEYDARIMAEGYLQRVAAEQLPGNHAIHQEVTEGGTADVILEYAAGQNVDLIAMTTHGRGGISRLMLGSIAEEIIQRSHLPVLLVRPT